jgi:glycosyltransferase involved in cell wall biosynthesis
VAGRLLRGRTDLPWIADWRDPWLTHADLDLARADVRAKQAMIRRMAHWCVAGMDAASAVDPADAEILALRPDLPVAVIPNGVDFEELDAIVRRPDTERLTLTFTGWFFGERSPTVLLEATAALLIARPNLRERLRLRFIGGFPAAERERVAALGLDDVVVVEPPVGHAQALQAQADADVGLLFMQDAQSGADFRPAKTWELLAAGRPILAVVPPAGAAAAELEGRDAEIVAPGDGVGARTALERLIERWESGTLEGASLDAVTRERISRQAQAEALAELIRATVVGA